MFEFTPQLPGRNVRFSWKPPALLNRNGDITNYNLTCVATGTSIVTANYSTAGTYILSGFEALTTYICSVYAQNAAGSGPPATQTATTMEDGMRLLLLYNILLGPSYHYLCTVPEGAPHIIQGRGVDGVPLLVDLSWQPPLPELRDGDIVGYNIACGGVTTTTAELSIRVSVPTPATRYTCSVAAATAVGPGVSGSVGALSGNCTLPVCTLYCCMYIPFIQYQLSQW